VDIVAYARRFSTIVGIFLLLSSMTISYVFSTAKHGCAPATPPPVAGTLAQPEATAHAVFINEVLSNPGSIWNCADEGATSAENEDWVEIYNPQNQALDLYAVHSSLDSGPNTTPFYLPVGAALTAHGFLVVFPPPSIFAQLSSAAGSSLLRLLIDGTVVDQVTLFPLVSDTSYGRIPDGSNIWVVMDTPIIDASNVLPTPKPTRTPKASSTKTASKDSTGTLADGATTDTSNQSIGTQPAWHTLSVPATTSSVSETTPGTIANSASQANNAGDLPQKVLLTSLAAALLLGLLWCGRFLTRAKKLAGDSSDKSASHVNDVSSKETVIIPIISDDHHQEI
jgi:hypothetical protein